MSSTLVTLFIRNDISQIGSIISQVLNQAFIIAILIISAVSLGIYWLSDQQRIERLWLSLLPVKLRGLVRSMWNQIYQEAGSYVRTEFLLVIFSTVVLFLIYRLLGISGAMLLALTAGVIQVVPILGIPLAVIASAVVGVTLSPLSAILASGSTLVLLLLLRYTLAPRILQGMVPLNPVLVIIVIMSLAELTGFWTIVFGPPLAAAIQVALRVYRSSRNATVFASDSAELQQIESRIEALAQHIQEQPEEIPHLNGLVERARKLVDEAVMMQPKV